MKASSLARTLRLLAHLLRYPDRALRADLPLLRRAIIDDRAIAQPRRAELARLVDSLADADPLAAESAYVALFDRGRRTSLHLFEHVHGESRERGPAMVDLAQTYEAAGLHLAPGELPDYLPVFLEYASTQPAREARAALGEVAHILNRLFAALDERGSPYASVPGALLELAGGKAQAVSLPPDEPLDATWEEPAAFAGCSVNGQARPTAPQPIQFVRHGAAP